jgi:hypothetical protein
MAGLSAIIVDQFGQPPALPAADIDRAAAFARQDKAPSKRSLIEALREGIAVKTVTLLRA